MFGFLKRKTSRTLKYDSKLVKKFCKDHKRLIETVKNISNNLESHNYKKAKSFLKQLKIEILGHFMEEDIKLYRYLKKYYDTSTEKATLIKDFETSIKIIQRETITFLDLYTKEDAILDETFKEKFYKIVDKLGTRIEAEENNLYPLYIK